LNSKTNSGKPKMPKKWEKDGESGQRGGFMNDGMILQGILRDPLYLFLCFWDPGSSFQAAGPWVSLQ
jgi:hypothetical protein